MAKINRSAKTGKFVTEKQAKKSPSTTTSEGVKGIDVVVDGRVLTRNRHYKYKNGVVTLLHVQFIK